MTYVTIFFQDVGTGLIKFTDLVIVKNLHLIGCLYYWNSLSHDASNIFSIGNCTQATFSAFLFIILKDECVLTTYDWILF